MLKFISNPVALIFGACTLFAEQAQACASCSFNDDSSPYFLVLIVFMTSLPVIAVGSVVYYLKKHSETPTEKQNDENGTRP